MQCLCGPEGMSWGTIFLGVKGLEDFLAIVIWKVLEIV